MPMYFSDSIKDFLDFNKITIQIILRFLSNLMGNWWYFEKLNKISMVKLNLNKNLLLLSSLNVLGKREFLRNFFEKLG